VRYEHKSGSSCANKIAVFLTKVLRLVTHFTIT